LLPAMRNPAPHNRWGDGIRTRAILRDKALPIPETGTIFWIYRSNRKKATGLVVRFIIRSP